MAKEIQLRRGTSARWAEVNPVLAEGEQGFETDTKLSKIGDGVTAWNELPYDTGGVEIINGASDVFRGPINEGQTTNPNVHVYYHMTRKRFIFRDMDMSENNLYAHALDYIEAKYQNDNGILLDKIYHLIPGDDVSGGHMRDEQWFSSRIVDEEGSRELLPISIVSTPYEDLWQAPGIKKPGIRIFASDDIYSKHGAQSISMGYSSEAQGDCSIAIGNTISEGFISFSMGSGNHNYSAHGLAFGDGASAGRIETFTPGFDIKSGGNACTAVNKGTARGDFSLAANGANADNMYQASVGYDNTNEEIPSPTSFDQSKRIFCVGGGTKDALKMLGTGESWFGGKIHQPAADYAEMFEWDDANTENEDRVGYFVTLNNNKITKAKSTDKYILGIVSGAPAIVGDNPSLWHDQYINDEWGRPIFEDVEVTYKESVPYTIEERQALIEAESKRLKENDKLSENEAYVKAEKNVPYTYKVDKTRTDHVRKLNPKWNADTPYVDRTQRKEWAAIGLMGKLLVRQDGTLKAGGYCLPNNDGVATTTTSTKGYYVMEIKNDKQALVMFR